VTFGPAPCPVSGLASRLGGAIAALLAGFAPLFLLAAVRRFYALALLVTVNMPVMPFWAWPGTGHRYR